MSYANPVKCMTLRLYVNVGMHHQGVFRVPGLQHEIAEFKNQFERGQMVVTFR